MSEAGMGRFQAGGLGIGVLSPFQEPSNCPSSTRISELTLPPPPVTPFHSLPIV
jgi:hypothetical protein